MNQGNWLRTFFRRGNPTRKLVNAAEFNIVHNFIAGLSGVGCRVIKTRSGRNCQIVVDGYSDLPFPPGEHPAWTYDGPFCVTVEYNTASPAKRSVLRVGQGYIFIGSALYHAAPIGGSGTGAAEYDWPARDTADPYTATDTDTLDVSAKADGYHLLFMETPIDPNQGYFTTSYKPVLNMCAEADFDHRALDHILARVKVKSGEVSEIRQDQRSNIRGLSYCKMFMDTTNDSAHRGYMLANVTFAPVPNYKFTPISVDEGGTAIHTNVVTLLADDNTGSPVAGGTEINGGAA